MDGGRPFPNWMKYYARPSWRTGVMSHVVPLLLAKASAVAMQANEMYLSRRVHVRPRDHDSVEQITTTPATGGADTWILAASTVKGMTALKNTRCE